MKERGNLIKSLKNQCKIALKSSYYRYFRDGTFSIDVYIISKSHRKYLVKLQKQNKNIKRLQKEFVTIVKWGSTSRSMYL